MTEKEKAVQKNCTTPITRSDVNTNRTAPIVTGQRALVLSILRRGPTLSLSLTADHAIPEAASRIHELREQGFNIETVLQNAIMFRGNERRKVALYVLKNPEWPSPDFTPDNLPPAA
ncbi:helix-turn-helix domain-containing protein [Aeromonas sp. D3]|uniref:helix-turn-helix domain-containing protein n=1 Tax=Aeromonas sp. D3 TaxID=2990474 RepID=UPI0022E6B759|nr:helix-turn-helix domain-containing protein [Aeromonas sp. D3]